jgi:hypothetical protein
MRQAATNHGMTISLPEFLVAHISSAHRVSGEAADVMS